MARYQYQDIRIVHLEVSSLCNAECPLCPRNLQGYPYNDGYIERNLSLSEVKHIFSHDFLQQLHHILINGNFGDFVMNSESLAIVNYFYDQNPNLTIKISTNGSARNSQFWRHLADPRTEIEFCLDGLDDTHHLYRRNTRYQTVINNAKAYISAGGNATWKMLVFDHNRHQIHACQSLSESMGFQKFLSIYTARNSGAVYDKNGNLVYSIGTATGPTNISKLLKTQRKTHDPEPVTAEVKPIDCRVAKDKSIYVSSTGDVYPCCWLGIEPKTYGQGDPLQKGNWIKNANSQVATLVKENNALAYSIEHCMKWFEQVVASWNVSDFNSGRLLHCNDTCGVGH
jgi:sulfatase maturation enzyme AslB (radical SAM superfamily)